MKYKVLPLLLGLLTIVGVNSVLADAHYKAIGNKLHAYGIAGYTEDNPVTLTIQAPADTMFNGGPIGVTIEGQSAWTAAGLTVPTIYYDSITAVPSMLGNHVATISAEGKTASLNYKITTDFNYKSIISNGISSDGINYDVVSDTGAYEVPLNDPQKRGVYWDATEKCAVFDGEAYLKIPNPFGNGITTNGFSITMDVYIDALNNHSGTYIRTDGKSVNKDGWQRILDFSNGTTATYFFLNAGDAAHLRCVGKYDKSSEVKADQSHSYYNGWHNITLVVAPGGNITTYVDKVIVSYCVNQSILTSVLNNISGFSTCYIGTSIYETTVFANGFFFGKIRGFQTVEGPLLPYYNGSYNYLISYETNGGEKIANSFAAKLPNPLPAPIHLDAKIFQGWFTDAALTTPAVAGTALTKNVTLYAKWGAESEFVPVVIDKTDLNGNGIVGKTESLDDCNNVWFFMPTQGKAGFNVKNCAANVNNKTTAGLPESNPVFVNYNNGTNVPFYINYTGTGYCDGMDCIRFGNLDNDNTHYLASKTINLQSKESYEELYLLVSASGVNSGTPEVITVTIYYTDNTSKQTTFTVYDWYNQNYAARTNGTQRVDWNGTGHADHYIFCFTLADALDPNKVIGSIKFEAKSGNKAVTTAVWGLTGKQSMNVPSTPTSLDVDPNKMGDSIIIKVSEVTKTLAGDPTNVVYICDIYKDSTMAEPIALNDTLIGTVKDSIFISKHPIITDQNSVYVRVRAKNEHGQSKNVSKVVSFKVVSDGTGMTYSAAQTAVNSKLTSWMDECEGSKTIDLTIHRTIYKDGYFNTLCLPFDLTEAQIATSFVGEPKQLKQFVSASVQGTGNDREIVIETKDTTGIKAGKAYLISFEIGITITELTFSGVSVTKTSVDSLGGTIAYQGILAPKVLPYGNEDYLFLGEENRLYWPKNDGTFLRGFRAYFKVNTAGPSVPYKRGMKASFGRTVPTSNDNVNANDNNEIKKLIEEGRVVIMSNGVKYDMNGRKIVD